MRRFLVSALSLSALALLSRAEEGVCTADGVCTEVRTRGDSGKIALMNVIPVVLSHGTGGRCCCCGSGIILVVIVVVNAGAASKEAGVNGN